MQNEVFQVAKGGVDAARLVQAREALLRDREDLLVRYCGLLSLRLEDREYLANDLTEFNQRLTDYLALSHFEIMEPAMADLGRVLDATDGLENLVDPIKRTTDRFLHFTDSYQPANAQSQPLGSLSVDLDRLGQVMAERFELEDRFLSAVTVPGKPA